MVGTARRSNDLKVVILCLEKIHRGGGFMEKCLFICIFYNFSILDTEKLIQHLYGMAKEAHFNRDKSFL